MYNSDAELNLYYNKKKLVRVVASALLGVVGIVICFAMFNLWIHYAINDPIRLSDRLVIAGCKTLLILLGMFFCVTPVHYWLSIYFDTPHTVIDSFGIQTAFFGFLSWDDIKAIDYYTELRRRREYYVVVIILKDVDALYDQYTWRGRVAIFFTRMFEYSPIRIELEPYLVDEVFNFCQRFLKK